MKRIIYSAIFFILTALLLVYPRECLEYALNGLNLWFQRMVPTLLPFMILSGMMIRLNLTDKFMLIFNPILQPLFRLRPAPLYAIMAGFLCGFPMGARITADLYEHKQITKNEATYLLAFVNNIGPIYFLSFALILLELSVSPKLLIGMYGFPLMYGLFLRYTFFRKKVKKSFQIKTYFTASTPDVRRKNDLLNTREKPANILKALDDSITSAIEGITKLGGYMILFNALNIIPAKFIPNELMAGVTLGVMEITGGLKLLGSGTPLISLTLIIFGGFSCLAQTYSVVAKTDLSIRWYFIHKVILTFLVFIYFSVVFNIF